MVNHKPPIMDAIFLNDLDQKPKNFIDFQVCV
jgi:hypothetical protein